MARTVAGIGVGPPAYAGTMAPGGDGAALDAALDELYGVDPSEFVATRKELAARLEAEGEAEAAKEIGSARRPTTAASALNQLARRRPDVVETLLERSHALRDAQDRAVAGDPAALRDATRTQRDAMRAAVDAAAEVAGSVAASTESQILATLHAAAADPGAGELLRRGRLVREVDASGGFPESAGPVPERHLRLVKDEPPVREKPSSRSRTSEGAAHDRAARDEAAREREAEARAAQRQAVAEAESEVRAAEAAASRADEAAEEAAARVEDLRRELDVAQDAAHAARREHTDARRRVDAAERALTRLRGRERS